LNSETGKREPETAKKDRTSFRQDHPEGILGTSRAGKPAATLPSGGKQGEKRTVTDPGPIRTYGHPKKTYF